MNKASAVGLGEFAYNAVPPAYWLPQATRPQRAVSLLSTAVYMSPSTSVTALKSTVMNPENASLNSVYSRLPNSRPPVPTPSYNSNVSE